MMIKRGDIYYADLRPVVGSEQGGVRPVLIIQNDAGNRHSPTVICAAITSRMNKAKLPTHVELSTTECDITKDSAYANASRKTTCAPYQCRARRLPRRAERRLRASAPPYRRPSIRPRRK